MGDLLLCNEPIAAMPYYMEGIGINLYSMEELCYYIIHNVYLLGNDFMDEELCDWIETELGKKEIASDLKIMIKEKKSLWDFIQKILRESSYCSKAEFEDIQHALCDMQQKSEFECRKIRADRFVQMNKYLSAIYEYQTLIDLYQNDMEQKKVLGAVFHNLGTAYSRLFLFEQAAECYKKAFLLNKENDSFESALKSFYLTGDQDKFIAYAKANGYMDEAILRWKEGFQKEVEQIQSSSQIVGNNTEDRNQQIYQWKEEYREICRV